MPLSASSVINSAVLNDFNLLDICSNINLPMFNIKFTDFFSWPLSDLSSWCYRSSVTYLVLQITFQSTVCMYTVCNDSALGKSVLPGILRKRSNHVLVLHFNLENPSCRYGWEIHLILPSLPVRCFVVESADQCIRLSKSQRKLHLTIHSTWRWLTNDFLTEWLVLIFY